METSWTSGAEESHLQPLPIRRRQSFLVSFFFLIQLRHDVPNHVHSAAAPLGQCVCVGGSGGGVCVWSPHSDVKCLVLQEDCSGVTPASPSSLLWSSAADCSGSLFSSWPSQGPACWRHCSPPCTWATAVGTDRGRRTWFTLEPHLSSGYQVAETSFGPVVKDRAF